jgi:hypothetical protein
MGRCFLRMLKETSAGAFPGGGLKKEDRTRQTMILLFLSYNLGPHASVTNVISTGFRLAYNPTREK